MTSKSVSESATSASLHVFGQMARKLQKQAVTLASARDLGASSGSQIDRFRSLLIRWPEKAR